jgi:hypothetical protein
MYLPLLKCSNKLQKILRAGAKVTDDARHIYPSTARQRSLQYRNVSPAIVHLLHRDIATLTPTWLKVLGNIFVAWYDPRNVHALTSIHENNTKRGVTLNFIC